VGLGPSASTDHLGAGSSVGVGVGVGSGAGAGSGLAQAPAPPMSAFARALEAKRAKQRIKDMSQSQVLPLVQGKNLSFLSAKQVFLTHFPPFVPGQAAEQSATAGAMSRGQAGSRAGMH